MPRLDNLGSQLIEDYLHNGKGVLDLAIERSPATKLALPILLKHLERKYPLFADKFRADFAPHLEPSCSARSSAVSA